jgi:hypothetical protein
VGKSGAWCTLQVQLCEQIVALRDGKVTSTFDCGVSASVLPSLRRLSPPVPLLLPGELAMIELEATFLPHEATILCRSRGVILDSRTDSAVQQPHSGWQPAQSRQALPPATPCCCVRA